MMRALRNGALSVVLLCVACATDFTPRRSQRIQTGMDYGLVTFRKEGQLIQRGPFSSGLMGAMSDVPEARAAARTYRNLNIAGLTLTLPGGILALVGAALMPSQSIKVSFSILFTGFGVNSLGVGLMLGSRPYVLDAINRYNDQVEEPERAWQPPIPAPVKVVPPPAPIRRRKDVAQAGAVH